MEKYIPAKDVRVGDTVALSIWPVVVDQIVTGTQKVALVYTRTNGDGDPELRYWQCEHDAEVLVVKQIDEPATDLPPLQRP
jgi:hypothetical protein